MKKFALVGALAALTIATAACGGGSDTLSEDEYVSELEDLCRQVNGDIEDLGEAEDYRDLARLGEDAKEITEQGLADLQELEPPEELEAEHEDYVASIERTLDLTDDFIAAAEDEDDQEIGEVGAELQDEDAERNEIADDIGASDCVTDEEDPEEPDDPTDTTIEEEPTDTTEADDPTDTTDADGTIPRITVPPVDMTMPTETQPPVMEGSEISTVDINELPLPAGYTFENADAETLTSIQELYAEAFTGQIESIGGAGVADDATGEIFSVFVFFWFEDLDELTGPAFVADLASADDVASTEEVTTPNGLFADRILYTDQTEGLVVWGGQVSIVAFGDPGSAASLATFLDAVNDA